MKLDSAGPRAAMRRVAALGALATAIGCASGGGAELGPLPATSPFAMGTASRAEAALRHSIVAGDTLGVAGAIAAMPRDTLLRLMSWGLAWHRLGRYEASNRALQAGERIAEDRYTRSLRQLAGTAILSDNTANFVPAAHERAFMHYYGMLNYLALGNREGALVEARKANEFLARYEREHGWRSYTLDPAVEYVAAMLHMGAGDRNDAMVSLRKAGSAFDDFRARFGVPSPRFVGADLARTASLMGMDDVADSAVSQYALEPHETAPQSGHGTLVVLVENGFVAHRVEQKLYIPILGYEADALMDGGAEAALLVGVPIIDRTVQLFLDAQPGRPYGTANRDGLVLGAMITGGELVTMAWPRYMLEANAARQVVVSAGSERQQALLMNDLSAVAARSFEEEKPRVVRRMIFRGLAKYTVAKLAEKKAQEAGDRAGGLGKLFGGAAKILAQGAAAATESADIRSWSALPAEILAARFTLPPGEHTVSLEVQDADGTTRTIEIGPVTVRANEVEVRNHFVSGRYRGSQERFAHATRGVDFRAVQGVATGVAGAPPVTVP